MTTYPITYIAILFWLIFLFIRSNNAEQILFMRITGAAYGLMISAFGFGDLTQGIAGEKWLVINDSVTPATFSLSTFNDGYAIIWFWIILAGSMAILPLAAYAYISFKKEPAKNF